MSNTSSRGGYLIPAERIENAILEVRGQKVMLDADLAALYGATTRRLKEQVRCNRRRFPAGFMFELSLGELDELVAKCDRLSRLEHSSIPPFVFTEHGAVMPASVLRSNRAVEVSVFVVKAFVRMRGMLADRRRLALKLAELGSRLAVPDRRFLEVFAALKALMRPPDRPRGKLGF